MGFRFQRCGDADRRVIRNPETRRPVPYYGDYGCGCAKYPDPADPNCCATDCSHWLAFISTISGTRYPEGSGGAGLGAEGTPYETLVHGVLGGTTYTDCADDPSFPTGRFGAYAGEAFDSDDDGETWGNFHTVTMDWLRYAGQWYGELGGTSAACLVGQTLVVENYDDPEDTWTQTTQIFASGCGQDPFGTGLLLTGGDFCDQPCYPCRKCTDAPSTVAVIVTAGGVEYAIPGFKTTSGSNAGGSGDPHPNFQQCRYAITGTIGNVIVTGSILGGNVFYLAVGGLSGSAVATRDCAGSPANLLGAYTIQPSAFVTANAITAIRVE